MLRTVFGWGWDVVGDDIADSLSGYSETEKFFSLAVRGLSAKRQPLSSKLGTPATGRVAFKKVYGVHL
jgi:hypothetical protein